MYYTTYDQDGRFGAFFEYIPGTDKYQIPGNCIEGLFGPDCRFDRDTGLVVQLPPQPSLAHVFSYATKQWEPNADIGSSMARSERAKLLASSDWTQLPDVPLATKEAWATYRQALRDITAQPGYPFNVIWPQAPQ